jgi:hypothetical protein
MTAGTPLLTDGHQRAGRTPPALPKTLHMLKGLRELLVRGNVIDLAIAVLAERQRN